MPKRRIIIAADDDIIRFEDVLEFLRGGASLRDAAHEFGVSASTIHRDLRARGYRPVGRWVKGELEEKP